MERIRFPINLHATHWTDLAIQSRTRTAGKSWSAGSRNGGRLLPAAQNQSKTAPPLSQTKLDGDCRKWALISYWYPWFVASFKAKYKKTWKSWNCTAVPEQAKTIVSIHTVSICAFVQAFGDAFSLQDFCSWTLQVSHVLKFVPRIQQAFFHNMPLAFATAAGNYYVPLNLELDGLFYWWVPDTAFAVQEPYLIMFPPNSPSQYKQDIYKTAKDREAFA